MELVLGVCIASLWSCTVLTSFLAYKIYIVLRLLHLEFIFNDEPTTVDKTALRRLTLERAARLKRPIDPLESLDAVFGHVISIIGTGAICSATGAWFVLT